MNNSKRKAILAAASFIIENYGMEKLTLEAIAKQAGISKGGLLYHFPNKDAIIKGMIDEYSSAFLVSVRDKVSNSSEAIGKWHHAYLESAINDTGVSNELVSAYIATLFTNPLLLSKFQSDCQELYEEIEKDETEPIKAAIIRLAVDGLCYSEIFKVGKIDEGLKQKVIKRLISWTKEYE
ncbi:TetR/AcrR family transcriptional regulator [Bacillus thuringiensis]|uniref:TetR/AcrR family transcriptional regulator n=1 Tax=Bacillus thuringiensis TaxID=1428 RepID=UPI001F10AB23|nr:TetR/AcrR family transcriptional regulator [Bacillus thuringiensis]